MISWFKSRRTTPKPSPTNPGHCITLQATFSNAGRNWEEAVNVLDCLSITMSSRAIRHKQLSLWLELENGFVLQPQIVDFQPQPNGGVRTTTTIEVTHPSLIPVGAFEYQHSQGNNLQDSVSLGFESWAQQDLPVFLDLFHAKAHTCTFMEMTLPERPDRKALKRRIVLGPPLHVAQEPSGASDDHPFCPCCLLTNNFEAFRTLIERDDFVAIRLFALRNADGTTQADCRVNGEDWPLGASALASYATRWPSHGLEYRKQLVSVVTIRDDQQTQPA